MYCTYWCVTAQNHSIELNGKPCPSRHPSMCMTVPQRVTLTVDGTQLHRTQPMICICWTIQGATSFLWTPN
ncbi:unnamed protein product [Caretta caretta]